MIRVLHIKADASLRNTFHVNGENVQAGDGEVLMVQLQQFCLSPDARSNMQALLGNKNLHLLSSLSSVSLENNSDNNVISSRILGVFYRSMTFTNLYAGSVAPFMPISQRHLDRIEFWLEDDTGTPVTVPGNFSLSLVIKSVRT